MEIETTKNKSTTKVLLKHVGMNKLPFLLRLHLVTPGSTRSQLVTPCVVVGPRPIFFSFSLILSLTPLFMSPIIDDHR